MSFCYDGATVSNLLNSTVLYSTVQCTVQYTVHYTVQCTVQFDVQCTVHYNVQCTVQCTVVDSGTCCLQVASVPCGEFCVDGRVTVVWNVVWTFRWLQFHVNSLALASLTQLTNVADNSVVREMLKIKIIEKWTSLASQLFQDQDKVQILRKCLFYPLLYELYCEILAS